MLNKLLKNKIAKNASWLIFGQIAQMMISFIVGVLTARYLGPARYGLISYGTAYTAFFSSLCTLGINSVIVKELVNNREKEGMVMGTALVLKALASLFSCFTIAAIVSIMDKNDSMVILITIICSISLFINVLDTFKYWFQSYLKSKFPAILGIIAYAITAAYKVILIITKQNVVWFAFSLSIDYLCIGVGLFFIYKKQGGQRLKFSWLYAKQILKKSMHFVLPSLMVAIYAQTDKIMLKKMLGETEVAFYSIAVTLSSMWCFVLQAVIDSLYPSIMEAHKEGNRESYLQKNKLLYAIVFYMSIGVAILYCIFAKPMVRILYGTEYLPVVAPLRIVTWYTTFSYFGVARNAWIVCENKQRYLLALYLSAAVANICLNCLLIPRFGSIGAAYSSLLSQIVSSIVVPMFMKEFRPNVRLITEGILLKGVFSKRKKL